MKRLCYVLSAALFAILAMTACSQDSLLDESEVDMSSKVELSGQELANNLLASFRNDITRNGDAIYPDYYGGMYLNDDGLLTILTVSDDTSLYRKEFEQRCKGDNFKLKSCKHSLNELNDGIEVIKDKITSSGQSLIKELTIKSFWISDKNNELHIGLSDCSSDKINEFKTIFGDLPNLVFDKIEDIKYEQDVDAGTPINTKFGSSNSSFGYRAIRDGEMGFVMSGHAAISMGIVSLYDDVNNECGQIKAIDESVDAAFCALFSDFTATNLTFDRFIPLNPVVENVYFGSEVSLCGRFNSGSGTVMSTNYNYVGSSGVMIWGAVQATYTSRPGDSGGVIYGTNSHNIAGIHAAGITSSSGKTAVFIPASSINRALSLTMY